ncbi:MAG: deoxyribose-phosphate aldolase [Deltaproteobacteria bacterium]|nr:deoxyribose-phosphate aldolase [Deltaproteobacteria bacterium]
MTAGRVALASDHGGYALKSALKAHVQARGYEVLDVGTHSTEACDYPVFARAAAEAVAQGKAWRAIIVDGAGIGSCMVANKVRGVRAGMAFDKATAKNAREHNDAHVLTLGAGYLSEEAAKGIVDVFLTTECTVDRHKKRVAMIDAVDGSSESPARSASSMASGSGEFETLVGKITQVLTANPGIMAGLAAGGSAASHGSCGHCNGCGHCAKRRTDDVRAMLSTTPGSRVSSALGVGEVPKEIAKYIDHTLLKPEATYAEIDKLCDEAAQYGFASVCVNPMHVKRCAARLKGSSSLVCTVIGFPLGATPREIKALEARKAIRDGAREVDMVIAIGALKSGDHQYVYEDIRTVAEAARDGGALLKVIIETALLTDEEKVAACVLSKKARADFVKTSTGFAKGGATEHDVALMARAVDYKLGVKASGGVKSAEDARHMIAAGASRIGASVGVKIVKETKGIASSTGSSGGGY